MHKHKKYFRKKGRPVPRRKRKEPLANYETLWTIWEWESDSEYAFDRSGSGGSPWRTLFEGLAFIVFLSGVGIFCYVFFRGHGH